MISGSKLGTVAGKRVYVCLGPLLNFHVRAGRGWFCVQILCVWDWVLAVVLDRAGL